MELKTLELNSLPETKAQAIRSTFNPMADMLEEFESRYNEVVSKEVTKDTCKEARRLRLDIRKVRTSTEKVRKQQVEYFNLGAKAVNGVANILKFAISEKEAKLEEIEKHYERLEEERKAVIQQTRAEQLSRFVEDANERDLSGMNPDVWEAYLSNAEAKHKAIVEAEAKAEAERLEAQRKAEAERKRIEEENKRLKAEAERLAKIEAQKAAEAAKKLAAEREKAAKAERKLKAEAEAARKEAAEKEKKIKVEAERKLKLEREKAAAIEAKLRAQEAEQKAEAARKEAARQAELNKGDTEKVKDLINDLSYLKSKYSFDSDKNKKMYLAVSALIDKVVAFIKK